MSKVFRLVIFRILSMKKTSILLGTDLRYYLLICLFIILLLLVRTHDNNLRQVARDVHRVFDV